MKIDKDLRAVITAAARSQKDMSVSEQNREMTAAAAALLKKSAPARRAVAKAIKLNEQEEALSIKESNLRLERAKTLAPFGLELETLKSGEVRAVVPRWSDEAQAAFTKAGGILPPVNRRKWKADEVLTKLAAAPPDQRDAILAEYGINWS